MNLKIARSFSLPLETVTQTIAILAKRRAGKSYTMRRLIEQLFKAGQQVVIVDPKGDQWGVRSAADGKSPGLPIIILGGERGDVPLEPSGGEIVAKLVVEERVSALLDLSAFRKHEVATFMTAFLENLYRMKAQERYRTPMMLVGDEFDAIAPQKPQKGEERMLGAAEDIVRRGGQRGIGCIMVTQRSAVLNKNLLTQAQMLVALRTIAPQDLAAMDAWIQVHGTPDQRKILMDSLPSLPVGDAWFWSPGWPTVEGIFERVHVLPIETFDSGATPAPGKKPVEPKHVADVDLDALKRQMAATIDRAKADDPRTLRAKIADLERVIKSKPAAIERITATKTVEIPIIGKAEMRDIREAVGTMEKMLGKMGSINKTWGEHVITINGKLQKLTDIIGYSLKIPVSTSASAAKMSFSVPSVSRQGTSVSGLKTYDEQTGHFPPKLKPALESDNGNLTGPEQRILNAIAWIESLGYNDADQAAAASLAGYTVGGGAWNNPRGSLRTKGLIDYRGNRIALTEAGRAKAQVPTTPLTTQELHDKVMRILRGPEQKILRVLLDAYPDPVSNEDLAAKAGYSHGGGAFNNPKGRLRSLGLIDYTGNKMVAAKQILFLER